MSPLLSAVSSSARQIFLLLRCIGFAPRAQVQITTEGLRFSVEDSRVMQGLVFLESSLFTTFRYGSDPSETSTQEQGPTSFQIALPSLLESLQIFGFADQKDKWSTRDDVYTNGVADPMRTGMASSAAFDSRVLGMAGICRLTCEGPGDPLCIIMKEANVTTTCELTTYQPDDLDDIPFNRDALIQKIIMPASSLHDAITELAALAPERLTIAASPKDPHLMFSAEGNLGSASVRFSKEAQLLETFQVPRPTTNIYKFSMVKAAARAMAIASKVSIRCDDQGVLSLQFMIDTENGGVSFIDFRFVPLLPEEDDDDDDEDKDRAGTADATDTT